MKRLSVGILIALTTFFISLLAVSVWLITKNPVQSQIQEIHITEKPLAEVQIRESQREDISEFRSDWTKEDESLSGGYKIRRVCPRDSYECNLEIVKNEKVLAKYGEVQKHHLNYKFLNLLGEENKQLVVQTYSGGAHCCYTYRIYDLKPTLRLIFDGEKYNTDDYGNYESVIDLNGDGISEFVQTNVTFDYFQTSHAGSIFPPVIFSYDSKKGEYVVANEKYADFVLKEYAEVSSEQEEKFKFSDYNQEVKRTLVFTRLLYLIYAGKEKEGWKFFDNSYKSDDKLEFKESVKKELLGDEIYKSIYHK